jgi:hypothetical protein
MWTAGEGPATLEYVGKGRIHVSIDEALLEALRVRAAKLRCHQSDVITLALQRELSLELFDQTWEDRVGTIEAEPHQEPARDARTEPAPQAETAPAEAPRTAAEVVAPVQAGRPTAATALPWRQT